MAHATAAKLDKYRVRGLGPKEASFVIAYLDEGHIISRAARSVGLTEAQGQRIFKKPEVREAIARHQRRMRQQFEINTETVVQELALIGFARMGNYIKFDRDGAPLPDLENCSETELAAIAAIEFDESTSKDGEITRKVKFKLADKRAALVDIRKHLGGQYDAPAAKTLDDQGTQARTMAQKIRDALLQIDSTTGIPEDAEK